MEDKSEIPNIFTRSGDKVKELFTRLFMQSGPHQQGEDFSDYETTANTYLGDLGLSWEDLAGKRILDVGAGSAGFAKAAKGRGIEVVSLDQDPKYRVFTDVPYVQGQGRGNSLPFMDETFDLV